MISLEWTMNILNYPDAETLSGSDAEALLREIEK